MDKLAVHEALIEAACPTLAQMTEDAERLQHKTVRRMVEYIRDNLFEPQLNVARVRKSCGVRDNTTSIRFHELLGLPPLAYITHRRMDVARRLLEGTDLVIWRVAEKLGFSSIQVFSRAFYRLHGVRPSQYRARVLKPSDDGQPKQIPLKLLRRVAIGLAEIDEAREVLDQIVVLYDLPQSLPLETAAQLHSCQCSEA